MEADDIISYHDIVAEEKAALQKVMNFGVGKRVFDLSHVDSRRGAICRHRGPCNWNVDLRRP
jgi:hypothetical protein